MSNLIIPEVFADAVNAKLENTIRIGSRPSQILCKPPMWCRIEAPHRRFYI